MKTVYLMTIEEGNSTEKRIIACSEDAASIVINASTLDEALTLLKGTSQEAEEAVKNYTPKPIEEPEEPKKHYYYVNCSMEEMDERAAAFADTPAGKRFCKSIENAKAFTFKHSRGGLRCEEVDYLANLHYNSFLNGSFDIAALEYRRGYMQAKREAKAIRKHRRGTNERF